MHKTDRHALAPSSTRQLLRRTGLRATFAALIFLVGARALGAQQMPSPTQAADETLRPELDAITARGRMLAEYDQASWHGTDAVMALRPDQNLVRGYLARRRAELCGVAESVGERRRARRRLGPRMVAAKPRS